MSNKILIITSGGSQLITQLSTLQNEVKDLDNSEVYILYNGVYRESLSVFFKQVATFFGFNYLGEINFNIQPVQLSLFTSFRILLNENFNPIYKKIISDFPILYKFRNTAVLVIPVRVKIFSDIVLLSYLKPKKVFYTIDGVIDELPKRDFSNFRFYYLRNFLKSLPIKTFVYSPNYLKKETDKIGVYKEVDTNFLMDDLSNISSVIDFKDKFLAKKVDYLIFSQHFSLNEDVLFENEIRFYKKILKTLWEENSNANIVFKPHPRDTIEKIEIFKELCNSKLLIVDESLQAVPVEFFINDFKKMNTVFITANSSAPLCFQNNKNIVSFYSNKLLSKKVNLKIQEFAISNETKLIEI